MASFTFQKIDIGTNFKGTYLGFIDRPYLLSKGTQKFVDSDGEEMEFYTSVGLKNAIEKAGVKVGQRCQVTRLSNIVTENEKGGYETSHYEIKILK